VPDDTAAIADRAAIARAAAEAGIADVEVTGRPDQPTPYLAVRLLCDDARYRRFAAALTAAGYCEEK
jgi:hypothetical protein